MLLPIGFVCVCYVFSLCSAGPPKNRVIIQVPQHIHTNKHSHTKTIYVHKPKLRLPQLNLYHHHNFHLYNDKYGLPILPILRRAKLRLTKPQQERLLGRFLAQRFARPKKPPVRKPHIPNTKPHHNPTYHYSHEHDYHYHHSGPDHHHHDYDHSSEYHVDYNKPEIHIEHVEPGGVTIEHSVIRSKDPDASHLIRNALENKYGPKQNPDAETIDLEVLRKKSPDPDNYDVSYVVGGGYQVNEVYPTGKPSANKGNLVENSKDSSDSKDYTDPEKITEYISFIQKGYLDQDELKEFGSDHDDELENYKKGSFKEGDEYNEGEFHKDNEHSKGGQYHDYERNHKY